MLSSALYLEPCGSSVVRMIGLTQGQRRIWGVYGWLLNEWAFLNGSYACRSRGYRKYDRLCRAHGRGGRSEHWDRSPDFR